MSDLDDEELEATRKLNGVAKDSNIEEDKDVITLKNFIEIFNERKTKGDIATIDVLGEEIYSLENILAEREADKKRIKELEVKLEFKKWGDLDNTQFEEYMRQFIPVQKVSDVLQKNRNELFSITYIDDKQYKPYTIQIERINKIEKELLEDK